MRYISLPNSMSFLFEHLLILLCDCAFVMFCYFCHFVNVILQFVEKMWCTFALGHLIAESLQWWYSFGSSLRNQIIIGHFITTVFLTILNNLIINSLILNCMIFPWIPLLFPLSFALPLLPLERECIIGVRVLWLWLLLCSFVFDFYLWLDVF